MEGKRFGLLLALRAKPVALKLLFACLSFHFTLGDETDGALQVENVGNLAGTSP